MFDDAALLLEEIVFRGQEPQRSLARMVIITKRLRQPKSNFGRIFKRPKFRPCFDA